jgi:DNA-binding NarL/FixJ family response regulator
MSYDWNLPALRIHEASNAHELGEAIKAILTAQLPHLLFLIAFKPRTFDLEMYTHPQEFQKDADRYVQSTHRYDIWMKRSPIHPKVKVVRHSDYTPTKMLKRSLYYRHVLKGIGSMHGASLVAWQGKTWLGMVTIHRTEKQGDFTDKEMLFLKHLQAHFAVAVRRLAALNALDLRQQCFRTFLKNFPLGFLLVDWDFKVQYSNHAGKKRCVEMLLGPQAEKYLKPDRDVDLPSSVVEALTELREEIKQQKSRRYRQRRQKEDLHESTKTTTSFGITFIPAIGFSVDQGLFWIVFDDKREVRPPALDLNLLSKTEQQVFVAVSKGLSNRAIAQQHHKSLATIRNQIASIFRKLGVRRRYEILTRNS